MWVWSFCSPLWPTRPSVACGSDKIAGLMVGLLLAVLLKFPTLAYKAVALQVGIGLTVGLLCSCVDDRITGNVICYCK